MTDAPRRGPTEAAKTKPIQGHKYDGYTGGRCTKCDMRDTHPVHHKGDLTALGWPRSRKPDGKPAAKAAAPEKDK
jgi:hypothetical protein